LVRVLEGESLVEKTLPMRGPLEGRRVCVTGGAGFVGSFLIEELGRRGATDVYRQHGRARVTWDEDTVHLVAGESGYRPLGIAPRMENVGNGLPCIIEVQIGGYLGEDEVERLGDDCHCVETRPSKRADA
jgi:NAD(P)-dependent dehydrogenase (short-subunit alcohol dehydrogenase family)